MTSNIGTSTLDPIPSFVDPKPCIPRSTFHGYCWKWKYSKLRVRKPAADICAQCFIFNIRHKYGAHKSTSNNSNESNVEEQEEAQAPPDDTTREAAFEEEDEDVQEDIILRAAKHVEAACKQRKLVNCKIDKARKDRLASIAHSNRTYTLIADYGQNMQLPFFRGNQPGDTYYYTPLSRSNFGAADV
jgi:hypothetical protein